MGIRRKPTKIAAHQREHMKRAKTNQAFTADGDKKQQEKQSKREDKNQTNGAQSEYKEV